MNVIQGNLTSEGLKVALVVARFNEFINSKLLEGAIDAFVRHGGNKEDLTVVWVPGAFELPLAVQKLAKKPQYDGVVALGTIIRGATPHFDYVAAEASKGLAHVSMDEEKPVGFGVLTTDNIEQAIERAGTKAGNKGADAMMTVIEMVNLFKNIQ